MTDIYEFNEIILGSPISIYYTIIVCVIFFGIYYFFFRKRKVKEIIFEELDIEDKLDFGDLIIDFGEIYKSLDSKMFLKEISSIFRKYLEFDKGYAYFSTLTLEEIMKSGEPRTENGAIPLLNKEGLGEVSRVVRTENGENKYLLNENIIEILKDIYFKEYKEEELNLEEKERIYKKVKDLIIGQKGI